MKRLLFIFLVLYGVLDINAASNLLPTFENGKSWICQTADFPFLNNYDESYQLLIDEKGSEISVVTVIGDTIIDNKAVKILSSYDVGDNSRSFRYFMHEDNGKIYTYTSRESYDENGYYTDFFPLIDYTVNKGEYIGDFRVQDVETRNFHGTDRKIITFAGNGFIWIEGVGASYDSYITSFLRPIGYEQKMIACFKNNECVFSEGDLEYGDNKLIPGPLQYDFEVNGSRYKIISDKDNKVALINNPIKRKYSNTNTDSYGSWSPVSSIEYNGAVYTLSAIGNEGCMMYGIKDVILPSSIETIGCEAFMMSDVESVSGMENVKFIGPKVFKGSLLNEFSYPSGIEYIGSYPFSTCKNLRRIEFPKFGIKGARNCIFGGKEVEEIVMNDVNPPVIYDYMYFGRNGDSYPDSAIIRVPAKSVDQYRSAPVWNKMADRIFPMNYNLDDPKLFYSDGLFFSESESEIGTVSTVYPSLKMYLPGRDAMYRSTTIHFPDHATLNGKKYEVTRLSGFNNSPLEEIFIPVSVNALGASAFRNTPLKTIHGLESITELGEFALSNTLLRNLSFAEGMERLPKGAVSDCRHLKTLDLPSTIKEVGDYVIAGCLELDTLVCRPNNPPTALATSFSDKSGSDNEPRDLPVLVVPKGCSNKYRNDPHWSCFNNIIEMETSEIIGVDTETWQVSVSSPAPGELEIRVADGSSYEIWTPAGCRVAAGSEPHVSLPKGIYIVRCGNSVTKALVN